MDRQGYQLPHSHQVVLDRFIAACQDDTRVVAAFLRGSYASGKVEQVLPLEQLSQLQSTYCPLERASMLQVSLAIIQFYQKLARPLAHAHSIPYPDGLECIMRERLEQVYRAH